MTRMAFFCSFLVVGLTAVVLAHHERGDSGGPPDDAPVPRAAPPGGDPAAAGLPPPRDEGRPTVDHAALGARVTREVLEPLQSSWARRLSFSRVRQPSPHLHLRPYGAEERAPRETGDDRYVLFEVEQELRRFGQEGERTPYARVRVGRDTGAIEIAMLHAGTHGPRAGPWQPAEALVERMRALAQR